jgi:hypothetical protein
MILAVAILFSSVSLFSSTEIEDVLNAVEEDGIVIKDIGISTISVELTFWQKLKYNLFGSHPLKDKIPQLINEQCLDISLIMGEPMVLVTQNEMALCIKDQLEKDGLIVVLKPMAGKLLF